jgi:hypothetical protein
LPAAPKEKRKREKKKREETVYKISESEPSEREARETCERMRKMASSQKVPAPALTISAFMKLNRRQTAGYLQDL